MAAMEARDQGKANASAPSGHLRADVRPPIGQCTGDYSKFPELAGRLTSAPPASSPTPTKPSEATPTEQSFVPQGPPPLTGIVTARQLEDAIRRSVNGKVVLAADARLSPLASDLVREKGDKIVRATVTGAIVESGGASTAGGKQSAASNAIAPWLWWIDGFCPAVQGMTTRYRQQMAPFGAGLGSNSLAALVEDLSRAVRSGRAKGGMLFVEQGAKALCYVNRCRSLRGVLGTCVDAVNNAVVDLAPNVLVVEYPYTTPDVMVSMVQRMLGSDTKPSAMLARDLAALHRAE